MEERSLQNLQEIELDILKQVLAVLEKYNIPYFALGGTLLGAVRHQGFIPWDDDIDIGIPRDGYERFLRVAKSELADHLSVDDYRTQNQSGERLTYHCQVRDHRYPIDQLIANRPIHTFVWIDVFPLDGMPNGKIMRAVHSMTLLYRRMRIQFSMFDQNVHQHRAHRPWHERFLIALFKKTKIGSKADPFVMMQKLDRALKRYPYRKSTRLINFMGTWKLKEMFPKTVYGQGKLYDFEDIQIRGPIDADYVLRQMYGDYLTPWQGDREREEHHKIVIRK